MWKRWLLLGSISLLLWPLQSSVVLPVISDYWFMDIIILWFIFLALTQPTYPALGLAFFTSFIADISSQFTFGLYSLLAFMLVWLIQWLRHSFLKQPSILQVLTIVSLAVVIGYVSDVTILYIVYKANLTIINPITWLNLGLFSSISSVLASVTLTSGAVSLWRKYDRGSI